MANSVLQRIKKYIDFKGVSISAFEKKLSFSNGSFSSQLKNNKTIGVDKLENILLFYEDINSEWLLRGKGNMLKATNKESASVNYNVSEPTVNYSKEKEGIPLLPIDAFAGISNETNYAVEFSTIKERYVIPLFSDKQVDFMISVRGSSMYPKYSSGDVVACKFIKDRIYIQWNKVYVIDTISQGVMIKRLKKSATKKHITFRSDNSEYDDFDVPESDIRNIALVVGVIRLE